MTRWLAVLLVMAATTAAAFDSASVELRLKPLPAGVRKVFVQKNDQGTTGYELLLTDGRRLWVEPQDFTDRLYAEQQTQPPVFRLFNITSWPSMTWIFVGLVAQAVFAGRMILQWVASERVGRSVVPDAFWWMSLVAASFLVTYFIWRRDIVGVLGQTSGWAVYARNLWLINRGRSSRRLRV